MPERPARTAASCVGAEDRPRSVQAVEPACGRRTAARRVGALREVGKAGDSRTARERADARLWRRERSRRGGYGLHRRRLWRSPRRRTRGSRGGALQRRSERASRAGAPAQHRAARGGRPAGRERPDPDPAARVRSGADGRRSCRRCGRAGPAPRGVAPAHDRPDPLVALSSRRSRHAPVAPSCSRD